MRASARMEKRMNLGTAHFNNSAKLFGHSEAIWKPAKKILTVKPVTLKYSAILQEYHRNKRRI